jgi:hypothetical protein
LILTYHSSLRYRINYCRKFLLKSTKKSQGYF